MMGRFLITVAYVINIPILLTCRTRPSMNRAKI